MVARAVSERRASEQVAAAREVGYPVPMRDLGLSMLAMVGLAGCDASPYAAASDEELHAKARTLALPQRYALYVEVLDSRTPNRPILAETSLPLAVPPGRIRCAGRWTATRRNSSRRFR